MPEATVTTGAAVAARIEDAYKIYGRGDAEVRALERRHARLPDRARSPRSWAPPGPASRR